jgi:hypothetical protein
MTVGKAVRLGLAVALIANVALWGATWYLTRNIELADGYRVDFRGESGIPDGYRPDQTIWKADNQRRSCTVIRYVTANCIHCIREKSLWDRLASKAAAEQCAVAGIVPEAKGVLTDSAFGIGAKDQLIFLPMNWVAGAPPARTPTTMIFYGNGRLAWQHVGELTEQSLEVALAVLRKKGIK